MSVCSSCSAENRPLARFCDTCGDPVSTSRLAISNSVSGTVGRDNVQAGRDVIINSGAMEPEPLEYEVKWHWSSPITQAALSWMSLALGVASMFGGYQAFEPLIVGLASKNSIFESAASAPEMVWVFVFVTAVSCFAVVLWLRQIAKHETQRLSWSLFPALTGWGHRLGLARFEGRCEKCPGRLRFYNKPMEWLLNADGSRGKTTKRSLAAECERNPEHFWLIDMADATEWMFDDEVSKS